MYWHKSDLDCFIGSSDIQCYFSNVHDCYLLPESLSANADTWICKLPPKTGKTRRTAVLPGWLWLQPWLQCVWWHCREGDLEAGSQRMRMVLMLVLSSLNGLLIFFKIVSWSSIYFECFLAWAVIHSVSSVSVVGLCVFHG